jgi:hypothetical protein
MPNLVFEFVPRVHTLISCQNRSNPSEVEWDAWIAHARESFQKTPRPHRVLVMTEGGHPSKAQQDRLVAALGGRRALTSVVSNASTLRFVVSALTLANPDIKSFAPSQMHSAMSHLGIDDTEVSVVESAFKRLRQQLT